ncbi:Activator of Hsp90 ATPase 1 family protein [Segniliparus rotundus DSM 44985]|uniref:Activator of Hsp90 ATPase 1 family protein n=1 Tax=Segniliparus rotundus (strain ATCC BAA-972 / CDC 1076 / CIP 108378 / DSM 44985 / JCM 13578) TaxID=640132 RepID=D6ZDG9_SEGRD|nr:SRPBCC family protein [Segniliparus rotundus]ADG97233.1 Activator of Hsp90 ATPase 1 family protein [Segniliparus rotundus DSM 44985]
MSAHTDYTYVLYIEATPEKVWHALTDDDVTAAYWAHRNVSDWQVGSSWEHRRTDGSGIVDVLGEVVESDPPRRLVTTWAEPSSPNVASQVSFDIQPRGTIVKLVLTHAGLPEAVLLQAVEGGWPAVLSNLKTLMETGKPLSVEPWAQPSEG